MKNSTLAVLNAAVFALLILVWVFMAPQRPLVPIAPEIHNGTTCALKVGDVRSCGDKKYIVTKVYWSDDLGWIADEDPLTEL